MAGHGGPWLAKVLGHQFYQLGARVEVNVGGRVGGRAAGIPPLRDRTDRSTPAWASAISPRVGLSNQSPPLSVQSVPASLCPISPRLCLSNQTPPVIYPTPDET